MRFDYGTMRRIRRGEELDESDQTAEVIENMDTKMVLKYNKQLLRPLYKMFPRQHCQQLQHHLRYLQQDCQKGGLWNSGTITATNIYKISSEDLRNSDEWRRFNGHITRKVGEFDQSIKHANFRNKFGNIKVDKSLVITAKRPHKRTAN